MANRKSEILSMLRLAFFLLIFAAPAFASDLPVTDTMPTFWKFWAAAEGKPAEEQVRLFREIVVAAYPELYRASVLNFTVKQGQDERAAFDQRFAMWLGRITPHIPAMRTMSQRLAADLDNYATSFRATFPDYRPATPIYFMVSLGAFDGGTRDVNGKLALLFGVDMLAYVHGPDANLKVLFDHELFHQYHDQVWRTSETNGEDDPLWIAVWREGLATYVSERMNPGATPKDIFMFPPDLAEQTSPKVERIAAELLDSSERTSEEIYAQYFFARNSRPDLPPRSGYYVGYLVAKKIVGDKPLPEASQWRGDKLRKQVERELKRLRGRHDARWLERPQPIAATMGTGGVGTALREAEYGAVIVEVVVSAEGVPSNFKVRRPLSESLNKNAVQAVSSWRFHPAMKEGLPIARKMGIELTFAGDNKRRRVLP